MPPKISTRPPPPRDDDDAPERWDDDGPDSDATPDSQEAARDALAELSDAERRRVEMGLPMMEECCAWFARKYRGLVTLEELRAPATIALCEAAHTFRPGGQATFQYYAKHHVQGRLYRAVKNECGTLRVRVERAMRRAQHDVSGSLVLPGDVVTDDLETLREEAYQGAADVLAAMFLAAVNETRGTTPEEQLIALEGEMRLRRELPRAIAALPPELRQVIDLFYGHGRSLIEVAAVTGVHHQTAKARHARAIRLLRDALLDPDP